jgi:hypothetical protein
VLEPGNMGQSDVIEKPSDSLLVGQGGSGIKGS